MEANFFRFLARELCSTLPGRRIQKIHSPAPGVFTFTVQAPKGRQRLMFRPAKSSGLLFITESAPANPPRPPGLVMRLRKYFQGRIITSVGRDWPMLRLWLGFGPGPGLLFDVRLGLREIKDVEALANAEPGWPDYDHIMNDPDIWKSHPHISPPLRKKLAALGRKRGEALLSNLEQGLAPEFSLVPGSASGPMAWPQDRGEPYDSALEAAGAHGEQTLFPRLESMETFEARQQAKRAKKRLKKRLRRLESEENMQLERLALRPQAEALQANLYRMDQGKVPGPMELEHPELGIIRVDMDKRLSASENMARMFRMVAKGERGLGMVRARKQLLEQELESLDNPNAPAPQAASPAKSKKNTPAPLPKRYKGLAVSVFTSSDGFTMVRGKNAKANRDLLAKAASQFDYWFHVHGGPGAHVILRRDHPSHEVPERTMVQAATLAALKSYRAEDSKAEVLRAQVKNVRQVKGAALGSVAVDKVEETMAIRMDHDIELQLSPGGDK